MRMQSGESLLDCLYERLNGECMYLSDLKQPRLWAEERCALARFSPQDFRPEDWKDALRYLTGMDPPRSLSAAQARRLLLRELARAPTDWYREKVRCERA